MSARFGEDLGADELEVAEIMLGLEDAFEVAISDDDAELFHTIGHCVAFLTRPARGLPRRAVAVNCEKKPRRAF